jgi:ABC-type Fe3+/spermidine/putrescine transport system ATPase subunit
MIAGLEDITSGELTIGGTVMNDVDPSKRGIAMVFQTYALYPHMTVRENMGFALRFAGMPKDEIKQAGQRCGEDPRTRPLMDRKPKAAVRRSAPARRHRPCHRAPAGGFPVRRTALQPRRRAARAYA